MRAEVQRVEIRAGRLQPAAHFGMGHFDERRIDQPARDPRLVGHDHQQVAGPLEQPQRVAGPRKELELLELVQVADVDVERAVAVEEDGAFHVLNCFLIIRECSVAGMPRMQR